MSHNPNFHAIVPLSSWFPCCPTIVTCPKVLTFMLLSHCPHDFHGHLEFSWFLWCLGTILKFVFFFWSWSLKELIKSINWDVFILMFKELWIFGACYMCLYFKNNKIKGWKLCRWVSFVFYGLETFNFYWTNKK